MAPDLQNIKMCHSKSDTKQYLMHRPSEDSTLIVPKRFLTGLQFIMTDCSMMTVPVDSPYHKFFQQGRKRIETVVQLKVPGDLRPQAKCTAIDNKTIEKHLMFNGTVQGKRVRIWLDTGATHCFAGERLKNLLKVDLQPSQLKGVETANGHNNQILGSAD
jgi:predicted aspartyl protease